jgi:hypothetical protein
MIKTGTVGAVSLAMGFGAVGLGGAYAWSCATTGRHSNLKVSELRAARPHPGVRRPAQQHGMPVLPTDWGGGAAQQRPEAILANAVSRAMNEAWARSDVRDAAVAIPVRLDDTGWMQYGDGQTNAAPSFGDAWKEPRPPLVATAMRLKSGRVQVRFRLDRTLGLTRIRVETGQGEPVEVALTREDGGQGDSVGEWLAPAALRLHSGTQSRLLRVRPAKPGGWWDDSFPLWFRHPVLPIRDLVNALPPEKRKLPDGRPLPDPERVGDSVGEPTVLLEGEKAPVPATPLLRLFSRKQLGPGWSERYDIPFIHGLYKKDAPGPDDQAGAKVTGVGRGWTWVMEHGPAPFKSVYTCFEGRDRARENAPDGGVASGGGWHRIGEHDRNFAETILNSLERAPIMVASGTGFVPGQSPPAPHGLHGVAVFRFLRPGEAFVTTVEKSPWRYDQGMPGNIEANYHWFFFHQAREVCTEEWVSPCLPTDQNGIGLRCGG